MRLLDRVVWSEGMHLAQHQFQAQSRWFEDLTAFALSCVHFRPYGLVALALDDEALRNGTVSLVQARGVLPDGTPFHFPEEKAPHPLEITERFSPTRDAHRVLLSLPAYREGRANCSTNGDARYRAEESALPDETTGGDARPVALARGNFRLVLETGDDDLATDHVTLPLARVRRDGAGHFLYDPAFIPPVLQVGASPRLLEILSRLVDILGEKATATSGSRADQGQDWAVTGSGEVASFWLSHAIHSALPPLRHALLSRTLHPERLYLELGRLAGALCTFSSDAHPRDLPLYDHDELERAFEALDRHIRRHLDVAMPTSHIRLRVLPAEPRAEGSKDEVLVPADGAAAGSTFRYARVDDPRCVRPGAEWFLGVRSTGASAELVSAVPRVVKICASRYVVRIVKEAYPGLGLEHVANPPGALSPRPGMTYFRILRTDPCWKAIAAAADVGIYVPGALEGAELELVVLPAP